ncbi:MAG: SMI1/KNR4 family protein [Aureispira sp.]|nr:SMI1/KNR4 family protein [Aureispira sp.]
MKAIKSIKEYWESIAKWLDEVAKLASSENLATRASLEDLEQFKKRLTIVELPKGFEESYFCHNGFMQAIGLVHGGDWMSLDEILIFWSTKENFWNLDYIPFVKLSIDEYICLDLSTSKILHIDLLEDERALEVYAVANDFRAFLANLVNDLQEGNGIMGELLAE